MLSARAHALQQQPQNSPFSQARTEDEITYVPFGWNPPLVAELPLSCPFFKSGCSVAENVGLGKLSCRKQTPNRGSIRLNARLARSASLPVTQGASFVAPAKNLETMANASFSPHIIHPQTSVKNRLHPSHAVSVFPRGVCVMETRAGVLPLSKSSEADLLSTGMKCDEPRNPEMNCHPIPRGCAPGSLHLAQNRSFVSPPHAAGCTTRLFCEINFFSSLSEMPWLTDMPW